MVHLLMDGRMTGIEPARGGFTIHCLDPLGYIRPYPRTGFSLEIRSDPYPMTAIKEKLFPIRELQVYCCVLELGEAKLQQVGRFLAKLQTKRLGCSHLGKDDWLWKRNTNRFPLFRVLIERSEIKVYDKVSEVSMVFYLCVVSVHSGKLRTWALLDSAEV